MQTKSRGDGTSPSRLRAIVYARAANEEGAKTLASQTQACRRWAARNGFTVVAEHADIGPGRHNRVKDRPGLRRALSALQPGDILLVEYPDRLFRGGAVVRLLGQMLEKKGCTAVAASLGIAGSKLALYTMLSIAEMEREMATERKRR
jgi:DNA invertase Pin-like site-specific DNA recombinase